MIKFDNTPEQKAAHQAAILERPLEKSRIYKFFPAVVAGAIGSDPGEKIPERTFTQGQYIGEDRHGNGSVFQAYVSEKRYFFTVLFGKKGSKVVPLETRDAAKRKAKVPASPSSLKLPGCRAAGGGRKQKRRHDRQGIRKARLRSRFFIFLTRKRDRHRLCRASTFQNPGRRRRCNSTISMI